MWDRMYQGSVLEPFLFVLYINDLPQVVQSICQLFSDDTKLYRVMRGQNDINDLQSDIDNLSRWSNDWLLQFNAHKCKTMSFWNKQFYSNYDMYEKDGVRKVISEVETEKDLGVHFRSTLAFDKHISAAVNKAHSLVG